MNRENVREVVVIAVAIVVADIILRLAEPILPHWQQRAAP